MRIKIWSKNGSEQEEILRSMIDAGLVLPNPEPELPPPMSEEERRALAKQIGTAPGKPISEIIIEDGGRDDLYRTIRAMSGERSDTPESEASQ